MKIYPEHPYRIIRFLDISLFVFGMLSLIIGVKIISSHDDTWYLGIPLCVISIISMRISVRWLRNEKRI